MFFVLKSKEPRSAGSSTTGNSCGSLSLRSQAGSGPWRVPEEHNPFGVFIRTPNVDAIAARVDDLIIRPGGVLRHREWGLYEVGVCGPDGLLVRIGWPSHLMEAGPGTSGM